MEEENVWNLDLNFTGNESEEKANPGSTEPEMTVHYLRGEREKNYFKSALSFGHSSVHNAIRLQVPNSRFIRLPALAGFLTKQTRQLQS